MKFFNIKSEISTIPVKLVISTATWRDNQNLLIFVISWIMVVI